MVSHPGAVFAHPLYPHHQPYAVHLPTVFTVVFAYYQRGKYPFIIILCD